MIIDNWLSYAPSEYYKEALEDYFGSNTNTLIHDKENSKEHFYDCINSMNTYINLKNKYIYDCCCNIGSYGIILSKYVNTYYGVDINPQFIQIANYVATKYNITNCFFYNKTFFDTYYKNWYYKHIKKIDILMLMYFSALVFRDNNKSKYLFYLLQLIHHYKPKYIIFENMFHSKHICPDLLKKFIKFISSMNYAKKKELDNKINPLWIFVCENENQPK